MFIHFNMTLCYVNDGFVWDRVHGLCRAKCFPSPACLLAFSVVYFNYFVDAIKIWGLCCFTSYCITFQTLHFISCSSPSYNNSLFMADSLYQKRLSIDGRQLNLEVFDPCSQVRVHIQVKLSTVPFFCIWILLQFYSPDVFSSWFMFINPGTCSCMTSSFRFSEEHNVPDKISTSPLSVPGRTWRVDASWRNRWTGQMALWWCTPSATACLSSTLKTSCSRSERAVERPVKGECGSELWPGDPTPHTDSNRALMT